MAASEIVSEFENARRATAADIGSVVTIIVEQQADIRDARGGAALNDTAPARTAEQWAQWLAEAIDNDRWLAVVGTYDDVVFGTLVAEIQRRGDGNVGVAHLVLVAPEARSVGIGEAMMSQVLQWCRERGCATFESVALPGDRSTKNFFESHAMKARLLTVSCEL